MDTRFEEWEALQDFDEWDALTPERIARMQETGDFFDEEEQAETLGQVPPAPTVHTHDGSGGSSTVVGGVDEAGATAAIASATGSVAVGDDTDATAAYSTAIGRGAQAASASGVAIGGDDITPASTGAGANCVAIGNNASTVGAVSDSTAVGVGSLADGQRATAIGRTSDAGGLDSSAIGSNANASAQASNAFGGGCTASATSALAIGDATASGVQSISIGDAPTATSTDAIAIGASANAATGTQPIAIGRNADATGTRAIAIGAHATDASSADASGQDAIAIGALTNADAQDAVAVGRGSQALHTSATALGVLAATTVANQVMLGTSSEHVKHPGGVTFRVNAKTGTYTATLQDFFIPCDATTAGFTVTLPAATGTGLVLFFKKVDSSANAVTIDGSGAETIDGAANYALSSQYDWLVIEDRASGVWSILSAGTPTSAHARSHDHSNASDDNTIAPSTVTISGTGKTALSISDTTTETGLTIGGDTNLYRGSADSLRTDDAFWSLGGAGESVRFGLGAFGGSGTYTELGSLGDTSGSYLIARGSGTNVHLYLRSKGTTGEVKVEPNNGGVVAFRANNTGLAFYGTAPIAKPAPTGSRGGNAALASLLTELANLGLITDSTSA